MKDHILRIMNDPRRPIAVAGVTAFAGGALLGYFLGKRKRPDVHNLYTFQSEIKGDPDRILGNIESMVKTDDGLETTSTIIDADVYEQLNKHQERVASMLGNVTPPVVSREDTLEVEDDAAEGDGFLKEDRLAEETEEFSPVNTNIFAGNDDTWVYEEEILKRTKEEPYIIHRDEFFEQETDYTQSTLTYYAGDNIMADEQDTPVYNYERIVGPLKFGHGSGGDPNVFYVRNDKHQGEYEILRHEGMFVVEVQGLQPEDTERTSLKHSASRFRMTDTN